MTDKQISQGLKYLFLIHAIVSVIFGLGLWLIPGNFLTLMGWVQPIVEFTVTGEQGKAPGTVFIDPYITRLLGAALLALAFSSFWGWRLNNWLEVKLLVQTEVVYCILALIGGIWAMIRYNNRIQPIAYVIMVLLAGFAVAWLWALRTHTGD